MPKPRMFPDRPHISAEARRWILAAREAGATQAQIAVGIGHTRTGVNSFLQAHPLEPSPALLDTWRASARRGREKTLAVQRAKEAAQLAACAEAEAAHRSIYRCECGGYRSTPPDGVCVHGRRTREGIVAA